jgi:hypothetical protein
VRRRLARAAAAALCLGCLRCGGGPTGPSGPAAPQVFTIVPSSGPTTGGTPVRITGANFAAGATVTIGGVPAVDVSVESAWGLTARTGAHASGAADVVVTVGGQSAVLPGGFSYQAVASAPPVITAIVAKGARPNEPAQFADLGEEINVSATVQDPDTPADQLTFVWAADAGTFSGSGASVKWRAPSQGATPFQVRITLAVSDPTTRVDGGTTLVLHDSIKEVGDLARQFLLEFSDSNLSPEYVMRNFSTNPRCSRERNAEFDDVVKNRTLYRIEAYSIEAASVKIQFSSVPCAFRPTNPVDGDACAVVPASWTSLCLITNPECVAETHPHADGLDYVTEVYEQSQWRLCASAYGPRTGIAFMR